MFINEIEIFLGSNNYDLRISKNGRWIDQKCTPDVISIIADSIIQQQKHTQRSFSVKDIWMSEYSENLIGEIFGKPKPSEESASSEYDKFFAQPIKLFANAKILNEVSNGRTKYYEINCLELLEYISKNERNALTFLVMYIEKVMKDSEIWYLFENYFENQNERYFDFLKEGYIKFIQTNTRIKALYEPRRIFTKVLNPLAFKYKKRGTKRGHISKDVIQYKDLMYNDTNFRDLNSDKPKSMSRQNWNEKIKNLINPKQSEYQSRKAKKEIRQYNDLFRDGISEILDEYGHGPATQVHHIFPEHEFPQISMFLENMIVLTGTQHNALAHPNNATRKINVPYQKQLLLAKVNRIQENIQNKEVETIYNFQRFIEVLNTGLELNYQVEDNNFDMLRKIINNYYDTILDNDIY